jgi:hypothetical protein
MSDDAAAEWTCRFFREGDEEGVLDVLLATFGRWPTAELTVPAIDHLRWKVRSDDDAMRSHTVVEAEGRIIACNLVISQRVKVGERVLKTVHSVDNAVLPEYQGRGVGRAVRRFQARNRTARFDLYFGLESGHSAMLNLRSADTPGLRLTGPGEVLVAEAPFSAALAGSDIDLRDVTEFDGRFEALRTEAAAQFTRITMHTQEELSWRYCDRRAGPFRVVVAEAGSRLLGYAASRVSYGRGCIADLIALPGRLDVVLLLARRALMDLAAIGAGEVECWSTPGHPYRAVLQDAGFTRVRRRTTIVHKAVAQPGEWLACLSEPAAAVHVMAGDTDLI